MFLAKKIVAGLDVLHRFRASLGQFSSAFLVRCAR
jgi:hypothetical protein